MAIRRFVDKKLTECSSDLPMSFIHINKTAGTTFSSMLFSQFRNDEIAPPFRGSFSDIDIGKAGIRLYHGHMTYADWFHNGVPALLVCMLREPKARVISQYKSFKALRNIEEPKKWRDPNSAAEALEIARNSSFDEFLLTDHPHIVSHINNIQVQFLSDTRTARQMADVESAFENLQKFFFFGLTERYDDSVALLGFQWDNRSLPTTEKKNVSAEDRVVAESVEAQRALEKYTALDTALYEMAAALFSERVTAANASGA